MNCCSEGFHFCRIASQESFRRRPFLVAAESWSQMFGFSVLLIVVVFLVVSPLIILAVSYFHWLGEKREKEALEREAEEFRRECDARLGPAHEPLSEMDDSGSQPNGETGSSQVKQ
jgi:hypothetical protein